MKLKMNVIKFMLFALLFVGANYAQAQRTIKGKVTDGSEALIGANVVLKGTTKGSTTDADGMYSIAVPATGGVLIFSYTGFNEQSVTLGTSNTVDVALKAGAVIDEVVVQAYGQVKKTDITGSVVAINEKDFNKGIVGAPEQLISGRIAGLSITESSGEPGAQSVTRIRGGTSITGGNEPLYVIDGVPIYNENSSSPVDGASVNQGNANPLSMLNANDIESVSVLKDASATAIYGSRGANGVIIITTKSGKEGKSMVDYSFSYGVANVSKKLDILTPDQFVTYAGQLRDQGVITKQAYDDNIGSSTNRNNWQDLVLRSGKVQNHDLSFSSGNKNTQFRASVGYQDKQGIIIGSGLQRLTGRINVNQKLFNDRLDLGMRVTAAQTNVTASPEVENPGYDGGLFVSMVKFSPMIPIWKDEAKGLYSTVGDGISARNPLALATQITDKATAVRTIANFTAGFKITDGLTFRVNTAWDNSNGTRDFYAPTTSSYGSAANGTAGKGYKNVTSKLLETFLDYNTKLGDNQNLGLLAGYSWQDFGKNGFSAITKDYISDIFTSNNLGAGLNASISPQAFKETNKLISFFGRANYDFAGKYLLTATIRRDGSSRFGENKRWALFPSAGLGWRISEEGFLKGNSTLTNLKLRASWGVTGNQEIDNYLSKNLLKVDPSYLAAFANNAVKPGVAPYQVPNPDIQWESTTQTNVGLDFDLLAGKINGSFDLYNKNTDNLLLYFPIPSPSVVSSQVRNVGKLNNKGVEFALNANLLNKAGGLRWDAGANISTNQSKVIALGDKALGLNPSSIKTGQISGAGFSDEFSQILREGDAFGAFYMYKFAEVVGEPEANGKRTGKIYYFKKDGSKALYDAMTPEDRQIVGQALPKFTYGFNTTASYKGIDFGLFFRGVYGNSILNNTALEFQTFSSTLPGRNCINPTTDPNKNKVAVGEGSRLSSLWLEDGSFLRLDNATLGYTIPSIGGLRTARVYVSGQNLLCLTKYTGYDPEVNTTATLNRVPSVGIDRANYPKARTIMFGVNVGF